VVVSAGVGGGGGCSPTLLLWWLMGGGRHLWPPVKVASARQLASRLDCKEVTTAGFGDSNVADET
jgi:hypothetical protein